LDWPLRDSIQALRMGATAGKAGRSLSVSSHFPAPE